MTSVAIATTFETKIGCNWAYVRDITEIFASNRGFRGLATQRCQTNSTTTDPCWHGNEISDKIGNISACVRDILRSSRLTGIFGVKLSNDVS